MKRIVITWMLVFAVMFGITGDQAEAKPKQAYDESTLELYISIKKACREAGFQTGDLPSLAAGRIVCIGTPNTVSTNGTPMPEKLYITLVTPGEAKVLAKQHSKLLTNDKIAHIIFIYTKNEQDIEDFHKSMDAIADLYRLKYVALKFLFDDKVVSQLEVMKLQKRFSAKLSADRA